MTDHCSQKSRQFQRKIYLDMDSRLRDSDFNSGASEAHGMLCALACRGVTTDRIESLAGLFRLSGETGIDMISGLFELVVRDLNSPGFEFDLLIPDDETGFSIRLEAISNWCGGFVQGFFHDGEKILGKLDTDTREAVDDIMEISALDIDTSITEESEHELAEVVEFLRVAAQLIYEELNPESAQGNTRTSNDIN